MLAKKCKSDNKREGVLKDTPRSQAYKTYVGSNRAKMQLVTVPLWKDLYSLVDILTSFDIFT